MTLRTAILLPAACISLVCWSRPAAAEGDRAAAAQLPPRAEHSGLDRSGFVAGAALLGSVEGAGAGVDGRWRLSSGLQLGLYVAGQALDVAYLSGRPTDGAASVEGGPLLLLPLLRAGRLELHVRLTSGVRYLRDLAAPVMRTPDALRSTTEAAFLAHVRLGDAYLFRAGMIVGVDLQLQPELDLADQTQLVTLGLGRSFGSRILAFATADAGGTYGFNGDNGKAIVRGALGVRVSFGVDPRSAF